VSCLACDTVGPGGVIARTDGWIVDHCVGPLGVGTLIVKPKRHVLHVADLHTSEAAELGPLLQRVAAVVTELASPEQVYVCLWSHAGGEPGHIHFVVQPVGRELMAETGDHGPRLQVAMFDRGEPPDEAAAATFAAAARERLKTKS
jgi:diadenosine tetraphosphate (Ap4A) HIT family hydrolase